jgi:hypothetical protein
VDIPKSIRFTEGDQLESESWTFSVEVLQETLLGGGPPDEDPLPEDGVDPHSILAVGVQPPPFDGGEETNLEDATNNVDEWDHWAMPQGNNVPAQANAAVPQPMAVDATDQGAQATNNHSSITLTFSSKDSMGNSGEVNQPFVDHQADNVDEFCEPEAVPRPVIVHGNLRALNMQNFIQLGEGVQNVMLAYIDAELILLKKQQITRLQ